MKNVSQTTSEQNELGYIRSWQCLSLVDYLTAMCRHNIAVFNITIVFTQLIYSTWTVVCV